MVLVSQPVLLNNDKNQLLLQQEQLTKRNKTTDVRGNKINKMCYNTEMYATHHRDFVMDPSKVLKLSKTNLKGTRRHILEPHTGRIVLETCSVVFRGYKYSRCVGIFSLKLSRGQKCKVSIQVESGLLSWKRLKSKKKSVSKPSGQYSRSLSRSPQH